jgi:hypothetical protein
VTAQGISEQNRQADLARLIAKEMMSSLLKNADVSDSNDQAHHGHCTEANDARNVPAPSLKAHLKQVAKAIAQSGGSRGGIEMDSRLRKLLQEILPASLKDGCVERTSECSAIIPTLGHLIRNEGEGDLLTQRKRKSRPLRYSTDSRLTALDAPSPSKAPPTRPNTELPSGGNPVILLDGTFDHCSSHHSHNDEADDQTVCSDLSDRTGGGRKIDEAANNESIMRKTGPDASPVLGRRHSVATVSLSSSLSRGQASKKQLVSFGVSFANVEVRFYNRIVSDHPSCTAGPPIGIGWEYSPGEVYNLAEWEDLRDRLRRPTGLRLDRPKRERILRAWGVSDRELVAAIRAATKTKAQRRTTVHNLGVQKMEEKLERAARKVKSLLLLGKA